MTCYRHQGKWRYDFWKNKVRQRESGFPTKKEAKAAEAEARKKLKGTNSGFIRICVSRLRDLKQRRTKQYFSENRKLIKKLIRRWKKKKKILRDDIEEYLLETAIKSHFVANKELRFIKALFNHGIERQMDSENPADRIKYFSVEKKKKYIPPKKDVEKVLSLATEEQKSYLLAIINSLARVNEINKLKWTDNFEKYIVLRTRKSKNSDIVERKIPKNKTLKRIIDSQPKIGEYIYCHEDGKRYGYRSKMIRTLCKNAKVREFTYHNLRHYGASKLADEGVPITVIQVLLGHQRPTTTDIYLQSIRPDMIEAMKKLESTHKNHPYKKG
jgi:integrase